MRCLSCSDGIARPGSNQCDRCRARYARQAAAREFTEIDARRSALNTRIAALEAAERRALDRCARFPAVDGYRHQLNQTRTDLADARTELAHLEPQAVTA